MKKNIFINLLILLVYNFAELQAQTDSLENATPPLHLIYEIHNDSLKIKWAPANPETWLWGTTYGYTLTQHAIQKIDTSYSFTTTIIDSTILPYDREQFTTLFETHPDSNLIMVQAQSIHGEWELKNKEQNPALFYMQSQEFNNRYSYSILAADLSWQSALAGGLAYEMPIDTSSAYFYDLRLNHPDSTKEILGATYVHNTPLENLKPHIAKIHESDNRITLFWDKKIYEHFFTAYHIEKANREEGPYTRITEYPYISSGLREENQQYYSYSDSITNNYEEVYYRIIGINSFGRHSRPSDPIKAAGRDRTSPVAAQIDTCYRTVERDIHISWSPSPSSDLAGYLVWKARPSDDSYDLASATLIPKEENSYSDIDAIHDKYYYIVQTIDTAGNSSQSSRFYFFEYDSIPPPAPKNVRGIIDTSGTVILQWDHLSETDDLLGYKVFYANETNHVYSAATPEYYDYNTFIDTISLNNLTHQIYYKVIAIDQNFNQSDYSEILKLEKPDTIPPLAPQIRKIIYDQERIEVQWSPSPSIDVSRYELEYSIDGDKSNWLKLQSSANDESFKFDNSKVKQQGYFRVLAIDESGNITSSPSRNYHLQKSSSIAPISINSFEASSVDSQILLEWGCESCNEEVTFKIYKKNDEANLKLISTTRDSSFIDRFALPGRVYKYYVKAVTNDKTSELTVSNPITID